jgi:hypothetical protein
MCARVGCAIRARRSVVRRRQGVRASCPRRFRRPLGGGPRLRVADRRPSQPSRPRTTRARWLPPALLRRPGRLPRQLGPLLPRAALRRAGLAALRDSVPSRDPRRRPSPAEGPLASALPLCADATYVDRVRGAAASPCERRATRRSDRACAPSRGSACSEAAELLRTHRRLEGPASGRTSALGRALSRRRVRRRLATSAGPRRLVVPLPQRRPASRDWLTPTSGWHTRRR